MLTPQQITFDMRHMARDADTPERLRDYKIARIGRMPADVSDLDAPARLFSITRDAGAYESLAVHMTTDSARIAFLTRANPSHCMRTVYVVTEHASECYLCASDITYRELAQVAIARSDLHVDDDAVDDSVVLVGTDALGTISADIYTTQAVTVCSHAEMAVEAGPLPQ